MTTDYSAEKTTFIPGPLGRLEAKIGINPAGGNHPIGIVCHPHPLFQGTMNNKVITMVIRAWQALGFNTLRFNFRGVGESYGVYGEGEGEIEDLSAVLGFVRQNHPHSPIWLAGFSFGAYIALRIAATDPEIAGLISIAPALRLFDFKQFGLISCPWLIVQGDQDEVTEPLQVASWYQTLIAEKTGLQPELVWIPGASHFFHGHLVGLRQLLQAFSEKHQSLDH